MHLQWKLIITESVSSLLLSSWGVFEQISMESSLFIYSVGIIIPTVTVLLGLKVCLVFGTRSVLYKCFKKLESQVDYPIADRDRVKGQSR